MANGRLVSRLRVGNRVLKARLFAGNINFGGTSTISADVLARLLPQPPQPGLRDGKRPIYEGDVLVWKEDETGGGGGANVIVEVSPADVIRNGGAQKYQVTINSDPQQFLTVRTVLFQVLHGNTALHEATVNYNLAGTNTLLSFTLSKDAVDSLPNSATFVDFVAQFKTQDGTDIEGGRGSERIAIVPSQIDEADRSKIDQYPENPTDIFGSVPAATDTSHVSYTKKPGAGPVTGFNLHFPDASLSGSGSDSAQVAFNVAGEPPEVGQLIVIRNANARKVLWAGVISAYDPATVTITIDLNQYVYRTDIADDTTVHVVFHDNFVKSARTVARGEFGSDIDELKTKTRGIELQVDGVTFVDADLTTEGGFNATDVSTPLGQKIVSYLVDRGSVTISDAEWSSLTPVTSLASIPTESVITAILTEGQRASKFQWTSSVATQQIHQAFFAKTVSGRDYYPLFEVDRGYANMRLQKEKDEVHAVSHNLLGEEPLNQIKDEFAPYETIAYWKRGVAGATLDNEMWLRIGGKVTEKTLSGVSVSFKGFLTVTGDISAATREWVKFTIPSNNQRETLENSIESTDEVIDTTLTFTFADGTTYERRLGLLVNNPAAAVPTGTGGLNETQVKALIADPAEEGNTDAWPVAKLGSGTPSATTVLYGDGAWKPAPADGQTGPIGPQGPEGRQGPVGPVGPEGPAAALTQAQQIQLLNATPVRENVSASTLAAILELTGFEIHISNPGILTGVWLGVELQGTPASFNANSDVPRQAWSTSTTNYKLYLPKANANSVSDAVYASEEKTLEVDLILYDAASAGNEVGRKRLTVGMVDVPRVLTLSTASAITWSYADGEIADLTLDQNIAISIVGGVDGDEALIRARQDATGNRTLTLESAIELGNIPAPVLSTAAGSLDYLRLVKVGANWRFVEIIHDAAPAKGLNEAEVKALIADPAEEGNTDVWPVAKLGTGTPDNTMFLRGDGAWAVPPAAGGSAGGTVRFSIRTQTYRHNASNFVRNTILFNDPAPTTTGFSTNTSGNRVTIPSGTYIVTVSLRLHFASGLTGTLSAPAYVEFQTSGIGLRVTPFLTPSIPGNIAVNMTGTEVVTVSESTEVGLDLVTWNGSGGATDIRFQSNAQTGFSFYKLE